MGATLKGEEFAPLQILSLKSRPFLRKEAIRNLQKLFPLVKMVEGADLYHNRLISLGGVHIQLYIYISQKMRASTKF